MSLLRKIHQEFILIRQELVLIRKELRAIRELLEKKPTLEKSCIYDAVVRERNSAKVGRGSDQWEV